MGARRARLDSLTHELPDAVSMTSSRFPVRGGRRGPAGSEWAGWSDDRLGMGVAMDVVPVARSVRPGRRLETLGAEASLVRSARVLHRRVRTGQIPTDTPITVPTMNVTTAAAAPI